MLLNPNRDPSRGTPLTRRCPSLGPFLSCFTFSALAASLSANTLTFLIACLPLRDWKLTLKGDSFMGTLCVFRSALAPGPSKWPSKCTFSMCVSGWRYSYSLYARIQTGWGWKGLGLGSFLSFLWKKLINIQECGSRGNQKAWSSVGSLPNGIVLTELTKQTKSVLGIWPRFPPSH